MYGLGRRELRFALLISSSHFSQHVFYRILPPLIPILVVALEYPYWQLGLLISMYSVGMGVVQAPLGVLSDRFDRIYLLPSGIALTGAAYVVFVFAPLAGEPLPGVTLLGHTFEGAFLVMALSMVGVGVGLSVVHPVGYPMISDNVRIENKGKVLGLFGASSKLGDAAAPATIAGLILILAWQEIILLFGVAGVLYGIALYLILRQGDIETVPKGQRGTSKSISDDTGEPRDPRAYLYPMIAVYGFFIASGLATHGLNTFLPTFIVDVYAFSVAVGSLEIGPESVANLYFALLLLSGAVMQLIFGALADAFEPISIMLACMIAATVGMLLFALLPVHPFILILIVIALGAGLYGVNPARDALISELSPAEREGRTFGYIFTAVTLTGAPLPTVIGYLLDLLGMRAGFFLLAFGPVIAGLAIAALYSDRIYRAPPGVGKPEMG